MCQGSAMGAPGGWSGRCRATRAGLVGLSALIACATPAPTALPPEVLAPYLERVRVVRGAEIAPRVEAHLLAPGAVRRRLELEMGRLVGPEQRADTTAILRALGLVAPHGDPWDDLLDLQAQSVAGFYAALDDRLYVVARGEPSVEDVLTRPLVAEVLIHELAHAFQASGSRLPGLGLGLDGFDDVAFAFAAVLEGDAVWTEHRDIERRGGEPPPDAETYARRFDVDVEAVLSDGSPWLRAMFLRPYPLGYEWVWRVWQNEGQAGLKRMLAEPPLTSAALLHPERTAAGRNEIEARPEQFAPDPECRSRTTSSFGEIGLISWFSTDEASAGENPSWRADAALPEEVATWRADRAWLLACPKGEVLAWLLLVDGPETARGLEPRLRQRAAALASGGAEVERFGSRLLVQRGLEKAGRRWLLERAPIRHYPDLASWLAAHPQVSEASERLRESAAAR